MALTSYNGILSRMSNGFGAVETLYGDQQVSTTQVFGGASTQCQRFISTKAIPNPLPSGVTAIIPLLVHVENSGAIPVLVGRMIDFGSLNLATNVFTDGAAMATLTEGNASHVTASALLIEVTTGLNATPGTVTVTYVDQDGNAPEAATAMTMTASAVAGSTNLVALNAGDWGVRDVTAAVQGAGSTPSGVVRFLGFLPLGIVPQPATQVGSSLNLITGAFSMLRLGAGDQLGFVVVGSNTTRNIMGVVTYVGE